MCYSAKMAYIDCFVLLVKAEFVATLVLDVTENIIEVTKEIITVESLPTTTSLMRMTFDGHELLLMREKLLQKLLGHITRQCRSCDIQQCC